MARLRHPCRQQSITDNFFACHFSIIFRLALFLVACQHLKSFQHLQLIILFLLKNKKPREPGHARDWRFSFSLMLRLELENRVLAKDEAEEEEEESK